MTCPRWSAAGSFTQAAWLDHIRRSACRPRSHWLRQCMSTLRGTAGRSAAAQFGSVDPCSCPDLGSHPHSPASPASALVPRRRARTRGPGGCNLAARARLQATQHRACSKSSDAHAETPIPGVLPGGASDVPDTHASDPAGTAAHGRVALDARQQPHARGGGRWAAAPVVRGRAP